MTLAQRVRDFRYSKGWGPDELATRAEISRTALYQIESGKTGLPRAGTLRRIAAALEVPMVDLLGQEVETAAAATVAERPQPPRDPRAVYGWLRSDGAPLNLSKGSFGGLAAVPHEEARFAMEPALTAKVHNETAFIREGELMAKLHDLLHSPLGDSVTTLVDELHRLLPWVRASS
jgi:transcriptional regulator with XRE-family HTH domain